MPSHLDNADSVDFIIKTAIERDPKKRRVKPVETQASILDFDLGESSDDSDFRIEDHAEVSDDYSGDSDDAGKGNSSGESGLEESEDDSDIESYKKGSQTNAELSVADVIQRATKNAMNNEFSEKDLQVYICCGCLGDQSDGSNEIVECDSCGVTVHEACYGVSDSASISSTDSLSPTAPWFCETCKAGVTNPVCELCPNSGGIFKETDVGKWVHLVCALYVPGVAFGEVDKLSSVTLFEMPYNKWGAKTCSLCPDQQYARTGVCIGCDAGMCRNYFHVTCAQREGFLSEAHTEEVDQADPFYAHCRLHSDKTQVKRRKRNYMALQLRTHLRKLQFERDGHAETAEQMRIQRKLNKQKQHYRNMKSLKQAPWVPTQKMPRLLTTSASACRKLLTKAQLMGVNCGAAAEIHESHIAALTDIRKKWHISPAFSVEFIAYYLDRNERLRDMKDSLKAHFDANQALRDEQTALREKYEGVLESHTVAQQQGEKLKQQIESMLAVIRVVDSNKVLPALSLGHLSAQTTDASRTTSATPPILNTAAASATSAPSNNGMMVPTAAALKMGVGFPLNMPNDSSGRVLSSHAARQDAQLLLNECGICRQQRDQHMLAKCDTCHLYYHFDCLNPPLTRLPKKSKLYGWQCSECDNSDSELPGNAPVAGGSGKESPPHRRRRRSRPARFSSRDESKHQEMLDAIDDVLIVEDLVANTSSETNEDKSIDEQPPPQIEAVYVEDKRPRMLKIKPIDQLMPPAPVLAAPPPPTRKASNDASIYDFDDNVNTPEPVKPSRSSISSAHVNMMNPNLFPPDNIPCEESMAMDDQQQHTMIITGSSSKPKKRRRDKHRNRHEDEDGGHSSSKEHHKRKRKKKCQDMENPNLQKSPPHPRITIKIKSIPLPAGSTSSGGPSAQCFFVNNESTDANENASHFVSALSSPRLEPPIAQSAVKHLPDPLHAPTALPVASTHHHPQRRSASTATTAATSGKQHPVAIADGPVSDDCDVCKDPTVAANSVKCDICRKNYHFNCLDPPLKKTPKKRGYSWHCADCDP